MIYYDIDALKYIAKCSEGGMRDAISMLDKCLSFTHNLGVEEIVKALASAKDEKVKTGKGKKVQQAETYLMLQKQLSAFFGSKVKLSCSPKGKGKISIPFNNEEELEHIMEIFDTLK